MQASRWMCRAAAACLCTADASSTMRVLALALAGLLATVAPASAQQEVAPQPAPVDAAAPGNASPESRAPKLSVREVMTRATALTVEAEGWTVTNGSAESGRFTTGFISMDPAAIPNVTRGSSRDVAPPGEWARAEYRYHVNIAASGVATAVRAEIRAWPSRASSVAGTADAPVRLISNGQLERAYRRAFAVQLEKVSHLFPPTGKDDP